MSEIDELKDIINRHIALFDNHVAHFKAHEQEERVNYEQLIAKVDESCENTKGLVEAWQAASGAIKVISAIGTFIKWFSGLAIAAAMLWALVHGKPIIK
jgi:hypothetical protein